MPNWANLMLTKKGKALQAKAVAGELLTITKMKLGSGTIPDGVSPEDLNDLIQPKQILGLTAIEAKGNLAKIQSLITNVDLSEGYYIRECGVFAQDPDEGEIMYAIMTDTSPDFLPPIGGSVVISEEFSINIAMENVSHITAIIDPDGLVTVTNAKKIAADAVAAHNTSGDAHNDKIASQEEAEAQTNQNNIKFMTPLRVWDAIKKFANSPALTGTPTAPTAAKGTNTTQLATTEFVFQNANPVGTIIAMAYTGVPAGYLHCNGAAVSRTTYAALFALLGTYYGEGDGNSTFNLPNTVAKFLEGGVAAGTYYPAGLPNITGVVGSAYFAALPSAGAFSPTPDVATFGAGGAVDNFSNITFDASRSTSIYGASETVQPPALTVIFCIKY